MNIKSCPPFMSLCVCVCVCVCVGGGGGGGGGGGSCISLYHYNVCIVHLEELTYHQPVTIGVLIYLCVCVRGGSGRQVVQVFVLLILGSWVRVPPLAYEH